MTEYKRPYQLYHTLSQNTKSRDISPSDRDLILSIVLTLSQEEKEAFFLLILEHYRVTKNVGNIEKTALPYGLKSDTNSNTVVINFQKLPTKLRQILLKFIGIVVKSREEEGKK